MRASIQMALEACLKAGLYPPRGWLIRILLPVYRTVVDWSQVSPRYGLRTGSSLTLCRIAPPNH